MEFLTLFSKLLIKAADFYYISRFFVSLFCATASISVSVKCARFIQKQLLNQSVNKLAFLLIILMFDHGIVELSRSKTEVNNEVFLTPYYQRLDNRMWQ